MIHCSHLHRTRASRLGFRRKYSAFGYNGYTPVKVPGLTNVTQLAAGEYHSLALHGDGTVSAFGRNNGGQ